MRHLSLIIFSLILISTPVISEAELIDGKEIIR